MLADIEVTSSKPVKCIQGPIVYVSNYGPIRRHNNWANVSEPRTRELNRDFSSNIICPATALSILDHYIARPATSQFRDVKVLQFVQRYTIPKELGSGPSHRRKESPTNLAQRVFERCG